MEQKLFHIFMSRTVGALERNIDLEQEKSRPKSTKNILKIIFRDFWSVNNPIQMVAFFETCRDFVLHWPKLFDYEGSNIP